MSRGSIPAAVALVALGLYVEPAPASVYLYIAGILCAGYQVVRLIVKDMGPEDMAWDELAPDEQPTIETTKPIKL